MPHPHEIARNHFNLPSTTKSSIFPHIKCWGNRAPSHLNLRAAVTFLCATCIMREISVQSHSVPSPRMASCRFLHFKFPTGITSNTPSSGDPRNTPSHDIGFSIVVYLIKFVPFSITTLIFFNQCNVITRYDAV